MPQTCWQARIRRLAAYKLPLLTQHDAARAVARAHDVADAEARVGGGGGGRGAAARRREGRKVCFYLPQLACDLGGWGCWG